MDWIRSAKDHEFHKSSTGTKGHNGDPHRYHEIYPASPPTDEEQRDTELADILFYLLRIYFRAPLQNPRKILQPRAASTRWISMVANAYPKCQVYGILAPNATLDNSRLPKNAMVTDQSLVDGTSFPSGSIDLTYAIYVLKYVSSEKMTKALAEIYRITRPGGWLEMWEHTNELENPGPAGQRVVSQVREYLKAKGSPMDLDKILIRRMTEAGFVDIQIIPVSIPLGEWGDMPGRVLARGLVGLARDITELQIAQDNLMDPDSAREAVDLWEEELEHSHCSLVLFSCLGRRPLSDTP